MIKQLENTEIEAVMGIWLKTNLAAHNFIPAQYWYDNYQVVKEQYLPVATTFVYEEYGMVKGFISIIDDSFIGALFVSPEYQGQGIGTKLINQCKSRYPNLTLAVYRENKAAVGFYERCDFVVVKEQPNEDSGFIEYVMAWKK